MDAEFLARMEDLLELYERPYDPAEPVVGFDERPVQLLGEVHDPLPAQSQQPRRDDYEYERNGTTNLLVLVEPRTGWRDVEVSTQRTKLDFARRMKSLVDESHPQAKTIHVVLDNLNTHTKGALYEVFPAAVSADTVPFRLCSVISVVLGFSAQPLESKFYRNLSHLMLAQWVDKARDKFHRFYPHDSS